MENIYKAYKKTDVLTTDPHKLILMLYDAAIKNLYKARDGIRTKDLVMRSEGLSKTIAIVSELLSAVQGENEAAGFLRGLYSAILAELPKINLTNDEKTLNTAIKYLTQLRHIWQTEVMPNAQRIDDCNAKGMGNKISIDSMGGHQGQAGIAAYAYGFSCRG